MKRLICGLVFLALCLISFSYQAKAQDNPTIWRLQIRQMYTHELIDSKEFATRKAAEEYLWSSSPEHSTLKDITRIGLHKLRYDGLRYHAEPGIRVYFGCGEGEDARWFYDEGAAYSRCLERMRNQYFDVWGCYPEINESGWRDVSPFVSAGSGSYYQFYGINFYKVYEQEGGACVLRHTVFGGNLFSSSQICEFNPVEVEHGNYCILPEAFQNSSRGDHVIFCSEWNNDPAQPFCLSLGVHSINYAELEGAPPDFCSPLRGNPCSISNGIKRETISDTHGLGVLEFSRYYTSQRDAKGSFGLNWAGSYDYKFHNGNDGKYLSLPDGTIIRYINIGLNNVYRSVDSPNSTVSIIGGIYKVQLGNKILIFDDDNKLHSIVLESGSSIVLTYDPIGRVLSARHQGREIKFEYLEGSRNTSKVLLPDGQAIEYRYVDDKLQYVEYPGSHFIQYAYEAGSNNLAKITHEDFTTREFDYNNDERLERSKTGDVVYQYTYASNSTTIMHPDAAVEVVEFEQGPYRRPVKTERAGLADVVEVYGGTAPNVTRTTTVGDLTTKLSRIGFQESIEQIGPLIAKKTNTTYANSFNLPLIREVFDNGIKVNSHAWTYNSRGQLQTQTRTDPATSVARTEAFSYCEQANVDAGTCPLLGLITKLDGPRTDVDDFTIYSYRIADAVGCALATPACYYRKGDLWKVTNPLGQVTEILRYDRAGRVLSVKDPNGVVTDFDYHPRGWLTARKVRGTNNLVETDDQITRIEHWPTGLVKQVTQPDGSFTAYAYDAAHRLTDLFDGDGNRIHYTLDNAGNRTVEETSDEQGVLLRKLSRVYNQLGQLETQKDAYEQPTNFTYDTNGNLDTTTDALNRITDNDYDPLNRLKRTLQDVGGIEAETKFEYDAQDNLTKVTDPKGLDTDYTYNAFGDLLTLSSPDTGTTTYTYDSAGYRKTQTDARNKTATYSYDALNRLIGITYPTTALNTTYTYDTTQSGCGSGETFSKGRLTRMQDSTGTTDYCYDRFGNLTAKLQVTNGQKFDTRYAYTLAGQLQSVTYPGGMVVDYVRNGQGQVTEVGVKPAGGTRQVLLHEAAYYPFGPVAEWAYGNGRLMQRSLNQNYQPGFVEDPFAGGLSIGYEFNEVGNLAKLRTADQTDPPLRLFGYDDLNRLTEVKDGATQALLQGYAYDATGNRESVTLSGTFIEYTYPTGSHRLSAVGSTSRGYDDAGNTTQIGGTARQFLYNDAGRLRQVKAGNFVTMNYAYNGRGEQAVKYLGSAYTYAVYDEVGRWLGDYDSKGDAKQQAIWLDDLPVGLLVGSGTGQKLHYVEPDALGTPRLVIDPQRDVAVWKWELTGEAFGNSAPNQDPDGDGTQFVFDMRFPGQRYDADSGLNYNYFRDYEPGTGRYSQSDLIGQRGGLSTYGYALQSPLTALDPSGLEPYLSRVPRGPLPEGSIYCVDGVIQPYYNYAAWPKDFQRCKELQDCLAVHEMTHVADAYRAKPNLCRKSPLHFIIGTPPMAVNFPRDLVPGVPYSEFQTTEFRAHAAELRCLTEKLRAMSGSCDENCKEAILYRINRIINRHIPNIRDDSYGR